MKDDDHSEICESTSLALKVNPETSISPRSNLKALAAPGLKNPFFGFVITIAYVINSRNGYRTTSSTKMERERERYRRLIRLINFVIDERRTAHDDNKTRVFNQAVEVGTNDRSRRNWTTLPTGTGNLSVGSADACCVFSAFNNNPSVETRGTTKANC